MAGSGKFDSLYISMVRSGEASGALGTVLTRVADYLEDQVRLSSKLTSIFVYPAVLLGFAVLVVAMLVTVVLPQITNLLLSLGQELPFYTRMVIGASDFARSWWWVTSFSFHSSPRVVPMSSQLHAGPIRVQRGPSCA